MNGQTSAEVIVAERPPSWVGQGEGPNGMHESFSSCVCRHDESERRSDWTARHDMAGLTWTSAGNGWWTARPGYGPVNIPKRPVRTRMQGVVGAGGEKPPATRLGKSPYYQAIFPLYSFHIPLFFHKNECLVKTSFHDQLTRFGM